MTNNPKNNPKILEKILFSYDIPYQSLCGFAVLALAWSPLWTRYVAHMDFHSQENLHRSNWFQLLVTSLP